ncbi:MAG: HEAT repeat domain-containing protein, partial [Verrucomicrobiota bacterium]|nr:HEAT repeat domain-containing protein [Verrucomicrobiota bacterium]
DYWGNDIVTDATGNANYFGPAFSGRLDTGKHSSMKQFWNRPSRPCPGTGILSSRHFPDEFNGNFLNCNVISIQGIFRAKVTEDGSGLKGETLEHLVTSDDPNFRPVAVNVGPDGAVYFADWSNAIIGHMQHHIRDPNRDHIHGRIYRMTYEGRPLLARAAIDGEPIPALLELLKTPEDNVRERAKIELGKHDSAQVAAAAKRWAAALDRNDEAYEHHLLEALWVHQWHNVVELDLLQRTLKSPEPRARAQAVRVLCYWRDRVPDSLALVKTAAGDPHPRVRLEAVRAASFFDGSEVKNAILAATEILKQPTDYYLDYTFRETLKQLQGLIKELVLPSDPQALTYVLEHMSDAELAKAPDVEPVLLARLERKGFNPAAREKALTQLAALHKTDRVTELVHALQRLDEKGGAGAPPAEDLGKLLGALPAKDLSRSRAGLSALADKAMQPVVRRAAWAAIVTADGDPAITWAEAKTDAARRSLADGIGFLPDPALRARFQPLLIAMLGDPSTSGEARAAALHALPLMGPENAKANFATLAAHVQRGLDRTSAARAIMQLPRESWDKVAAGPIAESILAWARTVPSADRTAQEFVETVQAGQEIAALLPAADAVRLQRELRSLGVRVFVLKTVREQMRYDKARLVVEAGKPFEVLLENVDVMPHNIVFVQPGTRQAVSEAVATMKPDRLDKQGRAYVPQKDSRVLEASKMLEPGQKETIKMTAPKKEGEYEYVCTFPGHWLIMWGKLIVTKDVDAYLQANPQPAVAASGHAEVHPHAH